ncbi:MAG: CoA-binding protein [Promethearchaeota archaeon]|nr:MAG: CoA-binding protein [Candidatus Lokiarchaeota archaeon]
MVKDQNKFEDLNSLFYPKHIAFIGASESSRLGSMMYLLAFKDSIWSETFYPINPKYDRIMDWKCYPTILDVPYPIDTAYISLKTKFIPEVLKECVKKGIKWIIIFASGFSETGTPEGKQLELELLKIIEGSNTRIIGPNCLGPLNAEIGMAFSFASQKGNHGGVSFMSQSGGHLTQLVNVGYKRDIRFRYGISFGNQIDLNCVDFMRYYRQNSKTTLIAAYLESSGSATGHELFIELRKTTKIKPVILWKGGYTNDGSRAAFSHTGAIASNDKLWKSMAKQTGTVLVKDNEEFWNTIKTFELLYPKFIPKGRNIGIVTPGGGASVNMTDLFASQNLNIPELTTKSQSKIGEKLPYVNVNIKNPIDLGASGFILDIYNKCIEIVANDQNIDIIIIPLWPDHIYRHVFIRMIRIFESSLKPFAFCLPNIADDKALAKRFNSAKKLLHKKRVLYFLSLREAARSISLLCDYVDFLKSHNIPIAKRNRN